MYIQINKSHPTNKKEDINKNVRSLLFTGAHIGSANRKQTIQ
jgi:hypothetical protein